jgi:two-component system sensor kinase FixL
MILACTTHEFVRRLSRRYLAVLAIVAVLVVVDQAIVQPLLQQANSIAPSINIAGRQRMISQRLTKIALAISGGYDLRDAAVQEAELQSALEQWTSEHSTLQNRYHVPDMNVTLRKQWDAMEPHYAAMVDATTQVISLLQESGSRASGEATTIDAANTLLQSESQFLPVMDEIVRLLEERAGASIARLQTIDMMIGVSILICLVILGWAVVRPATLTIRQQVRDLEDRVRERTRELRKTLTILQAEIVQREAAELKSQRLSTQLIHADRVMTMGHLTVGIAHELKQPLAAIANYAETCDILIEQQPRNEGMNQAHSLLSMAKSAANRAGVILRRMSNYVRPGETDAVPTDLHAIVHEIAELIRAELIASQTTLKLELARQRTMALVDPIQIQQVLINLLQNSLQAMRDHGSTDRCITISSVWSDTMVQLSVTDNGPGFTAGQIENAFSPFATTKADGLGIGLAICRSIIENHHGKIWIESPADGGAVIHLTLPQLTPHAASAERTNTDCLCC